MKTLGSIFVIAGSLLFVQSCDNKTQVEEVKPRKNMGACSWEMDIGSKDTINKIDCNGLKQGRWATHTFPTYVKIEEGIYKDDQKSGYWKRYNKQGQFIDSINYKNGRAIF